MSGAKPISVFAAILTLVFTLLPGVSSALHAQERVGLEEILGMSLEELMGVTTHKGGAQESG